MTTARETLGRRIRHQLADVPSLREGKMFGTISFMIDEKLAVCARKDGGLLVRVIEDRFDDLVLRPGAHIAEMGAGRTMGKTWIEVSPEAITTESNLAEWIAVGREAASLATAQ